MRVAWKSLNCMLKYQTYMKLFDSCRVDERRFELVACGENTMLKVIEMRISLLHLIDNGGVKTYSASHFSSTVAGTFASSDNDLMCLRVSSLLSSSSS